MSIGAIFIGYMARRLWYIGEDFDRKFGNRKAEDMASENDPFWFVWNDGGHNPRAKHYSEEMAVSEAKRLARIVPGQKFIVLQSVCAYQVNDLERIDMMPDPGIPF